MNIARAEKIIAKCIEAYPAHRGDCVDFVAEVLRHFLDQPGFDAAVLADEVVRRLRAAGSPWKRSYDIARAIAAAKAGDLVLAGLGSRELGAAHGHLALVIGIDGQRSGSVIVPMAYAGSIGRGAIAGMRLSGSFPAALVRSAQVEYFIRTPDTEPAASGMAILRAAALRPPLRRNAIAQTPAVPAMAWGRRVSAEFKRALAAIAVRIGVQVDYLMAAMAFETGATFSPAVQNPRTRATGLIQFMPATAKALGTHIDALAAMTAEAQLGYVERYFAPYRGKLVDLGDVYMAILWPRAVGKADDFVLFSEGDAAYKSNRGLDLNQDGRVTRHEASAKVQAMLERGLKRENYG